MGLAAVPLRQWIVQSKDPLSVVHEIGLAITSSLVLEEALAAVARCLAEAFDVWECDLFEYRPQHDELRALAVWARELRQVDSDFVGSKPSGSPIAPATAASSTRLVRISTSSATRRSTSSSARSMAYWGEKSNLFVPLLIQDQIVGCMALVEKRELRYLRRADLELLDIIARPAALVVQHARTQHRHEEQRRRLTSLVESTRAITSTIVPGDVLRLVAQHAAQALEAPVVCRLRIPARDRGVVVTRSSFGTGSGRICAGLDEPKPEAIDAFAGDREMSRARQRSSKSVSRPGSAGGKRGRRCAAGANDRPPRPVRRGRPVARSSSRVVETRYDRRFTVDEVELLHAFAEQAAIAIENARLYQRIEEQAITDGLTGLYNHRYFYDRLDQELARAARYDAPVSLLMIDLDDFKAFNDRYGHLAGDGRCVHLGRRAPRAGASRRRPGGALRRRRVRRAAAQYGGGRHGAVAGRRRRSRTHPGECGRDRFDTGAEAGSDHLTVCVGVAGHVQPGGVEELVAHADEAAYRAKRGGKDRVEVYGV